MLHPPGGCNRTPIVDGSAGSALDGPATCEEEHEVVLTDEHPVVAGGAVPVERVRPTPGRSPSSTR